MNAKTNTQSQRPLSAPVAAESATKQAPRVIPGVNAFRVLREDKAVSPLASTQTIEKNL
jgi:hypothetical protein